MKDTSVGANGRLKNSRVVALLGGAGAVALALGGVTLALAPSASADGTVIDGNKTCEDVLPGSTEIKFDNPKSGVTIKDGVTLTVHPLLVDDPDHEGDQTGNTVVNFTAAGTKVLVAIVKGGDFGNVYDYRPGGAVAGVNLHPPVNLKNKHHDFYGLSHVNFCVGEGTTPSTTPSETPSTTPSETPSTTPSETPSETPSTTPSETPSETPSTTPSETPSETPSTTPSETPSESPSTTPSESPTVTVTATPSESPTVSPTSTTTSTTSSAPVGVPTDVDAGLSGGIKNASATTSSQSIWGIALLTLGGLLVFAGVLKARQRRGQHSA
ncbi:hypothetical protein EV651_106167 [Kribbella sp. VKM Ac-2571]|uniref:hypothetical protein n=1 Tax=Kribbella sp. VKM Ac-2571 TaxID=2512222 RepID=UPI0010609BB2|nr:hypothetical protein [Kribbella sp. VKM Ac-2571]TDO62552.1 hypothetical protein EV651_106167 [Kribbella sp. VKM Ac-2571]